MLWAAMWILIGTRMHSGSYVPSDFGSYFSMSQEVVVGKLDLSYVCFLAGERARLPGSSPVLRSQCFSWPWPASVPLTTVVFPLGPFQQDAVGTQVPNDPERGSELSAEWKTTFHPGIHQTATHSPQRPKQQTGRKPAHVPSTEQGEFILTLALSIFRLFLHRGKHLQGMHVLSQGADYSSSKNQHV